MFFFQILISDYASGQGPKPGTSSRGPRQLLLAMHAEYTSITDELETVCGLLSPPRTPRFTTNCYIYYCIKYLIDKNLFTTF